MDKKMEEQKNHGLDMEGQQEQITNAPLAREESNQLDQSYWGIVKRQFKKNRLAVWSLRTVYLIVVIGLFADFIANDKPIYCKYNDNVYFPILKQYLVDAKLSKWPADLATVDWDDLDYQSVIWPIIPYSQSSYDIYNNHYTGPFEEQKRIESNRFRHWMGTDEIGRDVMAGMIHGTRIAMLVGIVSMGLAAIIGIFLGAMAGYFGDTRLRVSRIQLILNLVAFPLAFWYGYGSRSYIIADAFEESAGFAFFQMFISLFISLGLMIIPNLIAMVLKFIPVLGKRIKVPIDMIVSRAIEVVISVPRLLLILSVVAIAQKPSILLIMVIIGFTSWTSIARFLRGELLKVRSLEYIEAAQALGFKEFRIIFRHAIPNALTPVLIAIAFGVAGAILIESSLSFLGIGVQPEVMTWGKLLNMARAEPEAWWLAIFPGFAIFITVTIFNLLGEGLTDALDPKLKQ